MKTVTLVTALAAACLLLPAASLAADKPGLSGSLITAVQANDNVLATGANEIDDLVLNLRGGATWFAKGKAGTFKAFATFDLDRYDENGGEDADDHELGLAGTLKAGPLELFGGASHGLTTIDRTARVARRDTDKRVQFTTDKVNLGASLPLGGDVVLRGQLTWSELDFDNVHLRSTGALLLQDNRDRTAVGQSLKLSFKGGGVGWFAQLRHTDTDYDLAPPVIALNRDSETWIATGGAAFSGKTFTGDIEIGWIGQSFEQPGFSDAETLFLDARAAWTPIKTTRLDLTVSRGFKETPVAGSSLYVETLVGATVTQTVNDRLSASLGVTREWDDHREIDREDDVTTWMVSATYAFTPKVSAALGYSRSSEESEGLRRTAGFDVDVATISLTARF